MKTPRLCTAAFLAAASFASALVSVNAAPATGTGPPRVFLLDAKYLASTRQRLRDGDKGLAPALAQLEREAQKALKADRFSVVDKQTAPPSGDKHDYMSQAPYYWPNPKTTNGLPYIRRDGERNPEIQRISDHRNLNDMANTVETLALAFYFKGDETYAAKAAQLLRAWFFDPATRMNPNFEYAQAVPGANTGRGSGLIDGRSLTKVVDAVGLLAGAKAWTAADQRELQAWFARLLEWMQESKNGRHEAAAANNHGTHYDVAAASYALFLDKRELAVKIVRAAREKRIAAQVEPDGRQPLELVRTKAWSYSVFNLGALMSLAALGEHVGVDLWHYQTPDGRSIGKALDYLVPFGLGPDKWPHQQIGAWSPQILFPLLRQAAIEFPDPKYRRWVQKLPPIEPANRSNVLRPKIAEELEVHE